MQLACVVIIACFCAVTAVTVSKSSNCTTPNGEEAQCIPLRFCPILLSPVVTNEFVEASLCGTRQLTVCCGTSQNYIRRDPITPKSIERTVSEKIEWMETKKILPSRTYCGQQHWDDYFHTEEQENSTEANVDEFPWMVSFKGTIELASNATWTSRILGPSSCSGFLIGRRYIISSPFCFDLRYIYGQKLILGAHHIRKNISCITTPQFGDDCTQDVKEIFIEKRFKINKDIELAKLTENVIYTDFIRPICLPFQDSERPQINDTVMLSGWGYGATRDNFTKALIKQRLKVKLTTTDIACQVTIDELCVAPLQNSSMPCTFTWGGPLMYQFRSKWFATAITEISCSSDNLSVGLTPFTPNVVNQISDVIYKNEFEPKV